MFFSLLHRKQRQTSVNLWLFRYRTQETKILCRPVLTALGTTHHWDCFGCRLSHKELANGSCQQKYCLPPKLKFLSFRALGRKTPLVSSHHQNGLALRLAGDSDHGTLCIRLISLTEPYNIWTDIWVCPRCDTSTLECNASHLVVFGIVILIGVSLAQQWRWARFLTSYALTVPQSCCLQQHQIVLSLVPPGLILGAVPVSIEEFPFLEIISSARTPSPAWEEALHHKHSDTCWGGS